MFFILSKVLLILIQPLCWVFYLLIFGIFCKPGKRKKQFFYTAIGVLYFFSNSFIFSQFASRWNISTRALKPGTKYSCAIVLGGFSSIDENGKGYFNGASDRFIQALKLEETGKVSKILISGGSGLLLKGHDFKEADFVAGELRTLKVPDTAILAESNSRNTIENAQFSKQILLAKHIAPPYVLVTSAFHMRRALYTFKKAGIDVVPYACDFGAGVNGFSFSDMIIPDATALDAWSLYTKELVGDIAYHFKSFH